MSIYNQLPYSEIVKEVFSLDTWIKNGDVISQNETGFLTHKSPSRSEKVHNFFIGQSKRTILQLEQSRTPEVVETVRLLLFKAEVMPTAGWYINAKFGCAFYRNSALHRKLSEIPELFRDTIKSLREFVDPNKKGEIVNDALDTFHSCLKSDDLKCLVYDHLDLESLISFSRVSRRYKATINSYVSGVFDKFFKIPRFQTSNQFYQLQRMCLLTVGVDNVKLVRLIQSPASFKELCITMFPICQEHVNTSSSSYVTVKPQRKIIINGKIENIQTKEGLPADHPIRVINEYSSVERSYDRKDGVILGSL